jgi:hypothetical protein
VQAALQKANTELAAVQKQVADTTGAVKHWQNAVNTAAVDPTLAAAKAAGDAVPVKEQAVAKLNEVAARAKEAAEKLAGNAELATFSMQSQALAAKHATELTAAKQYAAQMLAAAKPAQDKLAAAHAELGKAQVALNAANQQLPGKVAAQKAAQDQLPAAQAAANAANAEVQVLEMKVARMQKASPKTASK